MRVQCAPLNQEPAMLVLHGRKNSSNVQKITWLLGELGLTYQRTDVGGPFGGNKTPEFLAMNPMGLVPCLVDGDFVLWESNTIARYICNAYGGQAFYPAMPQARALVEQWQDWTLSAAFSAITPAFLGLIRTPPEKRDVAAIEASQAKTMEMMALMEAQLGRTANIAGDAFTIADMGLGILVYRYFILVPQAPDHPNLRRWYKAVAERPAFKAAVTDLGLT
jgi:glutathione S-transferase